MRMIDNVRLEVDVPTTPMNRVPNPLDPAYVPGGWGWLTQAAGDIFNYSAATDTGTYNYLGGRAAELVSELFTTGRQSTSGMYSRASITLWGAYARAFVDWYDSTGTRLSWTQFAEHAGSGTRTTYNSGVLSVPAAAVQARIRVQVFANSSYNSNPGAGSINLCKSSFTSSDWSPSLTAGFIHKYNWVNILGPATEVHTDREAMNLGTLSATITDDTLDPATSGAIRQGKAIRLTAKKGSGWVPLFTGTVDKASTVYSRTGKPTISLTALDNMQRLANNPRPQGVSVATHLPAVLEGCGVPWNVYGFTGHTGVSSVVTSYNDSASAADQVALLRDTLKAQAWLDKDGVLQFQNSPQSAPVSQSGELVVNNTFDTNLTGWTSRGTLTRQTAGAQSGAGYARVAYLSSASSMLLADVAGVVAPYDVIEVSAWVRGEAGAPLRLGVMWNGDLAKFNVSNARTLGAGWVKHTWRVDKPYGATTAQMYVEADISAPGQFLEVDSVSLMAHSLVQVTERQYSDNDVDFNSEECINSVLVTQLVYNASDNSTEEVQTGPYKNLDSIERWGTRQVEATIATGAPEVWAQDVLDANSEPTVRINGVTIPVKEVTDLTVIDLCTLVHTEYGNKAISQTQRVFRISHDITPEGWTMSVGFSSPDSVASPQAQPQLSNDSAYLTPYGRRTRTNSAQSIGHNAWTAIALTNADSLTGGMEWDSSNNWFVVRKSGLYVIDGAIRWVNNGTGARGAAVFVNGNAKASTLIPALASATGCSSMVGATLRLEDGDTVALRGYQGSGGALDAMSTAAEYTYMTIALVGP